MVTCPRKNSHSAATKFLDAVRTTYRLLADQAGIGSTRHAQYCPELTNPLRFHTIEDFPRILIYCINRRDVVQIIRVWDAARGLEALFQDNPQS
jgi:toxin ParE1/3/4